MEVGVGSRPGGGRRGVDKCIFIYVYIYIYIYM